MNTIVSRSTNGTVEFSFTLDESVIQDPGDVTTNSSKEHRMSIAEELNNKTSQVAFLKLLSVYIQHIIGV